MTRLRRIRPSLSSIRVRLTLWYLLMLCVVFLVFGTIVYTTTLQAEQSAAGAHLIASAQQLASSYNTASRQLQVTDLWNGGKGLPEKGQSSSTDYPLGVFDVALLLDGDGGVAQTLGPVTPAAIVQIGAWETNMLAKQQRASGDKLGNLTDTMSLSVAAAPDGSISDHGGVAVTYDLYLTAVRSGGSTVAWLVVGQPDQQSQTLRTLVPGLLLAGPATLLLAALGGYWLATRAMRPVRLLTNAAHEIEATDLSRRINLTRRDELGDLAATFDGMLARLEAAFGRQRQFTADASHELRTPLAVVGLEVERALAQERTPAEYRQSLALIQVENEHMSQLVSNLLLLARADAALVATHRERVDLGDLVLGAVERLGPLARQSGIILKVGELPDVPVKADRGQMELALNVLLENGIRYTAGIGTQVSVSVGCTVGIRPAWIRVADDGPGIAAEHMPHIFERFYQADVARTRDDDQGTSAEHARMNGVGLGLAIAETLVRLHDGDITVASVPGGAPGHGTTFEIRLPLASVT